jgi:hypothetical protein
MNTDACRTGSNSLVQTGEWGMRHAFAKDTQLKPLKKQGERRRPRA